MNPALARVLEAVFLKKRPPRPMSLFRFVVVSASEALDTERWLPVELQYILRRRPALREALRASLDGGKAIGIRTILRTSPRLLAAVTRIATHSQHRMVVTWLDPLLREGTPPAFTPTDLAHAEGDGIDLLEEAGVLLDARLDFKKFVWVDEHNRGISGEESALIDDMNEHLRPVTLLYVLSRIQFDNADERTEIAQAILKAMLFIGPIAHLLEKVLAGIGKVFAASTDDVMSELAELLALRGSGFTWRQLVRRSRLLIPVFMLATYGAFAVEAFIERGDYVTAGLLFGTSAVALSLTTAIQSVYLFRACIDELVAEGKLPRLARFDRLMLAVRQDFTNPARLGLLVGAAGSPVISMIIFVAFPRLTHNGWILALLGTTETLVAGATVILATRLNALAFDRLIRRSLLAPMPAASTTSDHER
jgi:hypothetical protein